MKILKQAIEKAAADTALYASLELQNHAISHGWEPEVAHGLLVEYSDGKFQTRVNPEVADRAFVHEYGTETSAPKATLRTFKSHSSRVEELFTQRMHVHLGGKK